MGLYRYALCDLRTLKRHLNIGEATATHDLLLEDKINAATGEIEARMNRKALAQTFTEYHDGGGLSVLFLKHFPVASVASVRDDTDRVYGEGTLVSSDDYAVDLKTGKIELDDDTFDDGVQNVKVTYTTSDMAEPALTAVKNACMELAALFFEQREMVGVASDSIGGISQQKEDEEKILKKVDCFRKGN